VFVSLKPIKKKKEHMCRYWDSNKRSLFPSSTAITREVAWLHLLPVRTALMAHQSLAAELASRAPGKINES